MGRRRVERKPLTTVGGANAAFRHVRLGLPGREAGDLRRRLLAITQLSDDPFPEGYLLPGTLGVTGEDTQV